MSVAEAVSIAAAAETARRALALPRGAASSAAGPSAASGAGGSSHPYSPPTSGASGLTRMDGHGAAAVPAQPVATAGGGWAVSDDTYSWWTGLPGGGAAWQSRAPPSASSGLGSGMSSLLGAGATCMDVEEDGTGAVEADAGAGLDSLVASAYLASPPVAGFSGEGGAPSMTPAERAARGTRAGPTKHPKGRKATAQYVGMLCAGCGTPFVGGDFPPVVEGGHMVHARLTCSLSLASRETARVAEVAAAPAMHSLAGDVGKPLPHRPPGSDRAGKPSTLRAAAAAATGFAGGSSTGPVLLRTRMAETVNGAWIASATVWTVSATRPCVGSPVHRALPAAVVCTWLSAGSSGPLVPPWVCCCAPIAELERWAETALSRSPSCARAWRTWCSP